MVPRLIRWRMASGVMFRNLAASVTVSRSLCPFTRRTVQPCEAPLEGVTLKLYAHLQDVVLGTIPKRAEMRGYTPRYCISMRAHAYGFPRITALRLYEKA